MAEKQLNKIDNNHFLYRLGTLGDQYSESVVLDLEVSTEHAL